MLRGGIVIARAVIIRGRGHEQCAAASLRSWAVTAPLQLSLHCAMQSANSPLTTGYR